MHHTDRIKFSSISTIIVCVSYLVVSLNASPPSLTPKERRLLAEEGRVLKKGMSLQEILNNTPTGPIIEYTGFEQSDGFDPPNPKTGFDGFICGPEFTSCANPVSACPDPGGNCCEVSDHFTSLNYTII